MVEATDDRIIMAKCTGAKLVSGLAATEAASKANAPKARLWRRVRKSERINIVGSSWEHRHIASD